MTGASQDLTPLRVLVNALRVLPGGVCIYRDELVRGLHQRGDVELLVACRQEYADEWQALGVSVHAVSMPRPPFDLLRERSLLKRICRSFEPDIMHTPAVFFLGGIRWPCRVVATVHDLGFLFISLAPLRRLHRRWVLGSAVRHATTLIAVSSHTLARLVGNFPEAAAKATVVSNGFRGPESLPPLGPRTDHEPPFLLAFGHWPHKNCEGAVHVLKELMEEVSGLELHIVGGDTAATDAARRTSEELGVRDRIRFLGWVDDSVLWDLYRDALALIFLSRYEGSGLPVLEALAMGCPIVVSDRGALPETAADHGAVVGLHDFRSAAQAVLFHRNNPDESLRLRAAGRDHAHSHPWSRTVDETVAAYRSLGKEGVSASPNSLDWIERGWEWPDSILELLSDVAQACVHDDVLCALLTGSTARGELAIEQTGDAVRLRSDVELYVVSAHQRVQPVIDSRMEQIVSRYADQWPGFHIDVDYVAPRKLSALGPWIRHAELKANARVLAGIDLRPCLPTVDIGNLDWKELNEVLLWRLLSLVLQLPPSCLLPKGEFGDQARYHLARNLLDSTTWALPGVGIILPSFAQRVSAWPEDGGLPGLEELALPSKELLANCLAARSNSAALPEGEVLFNAAVGAWSSVADAVFGNLESAHRGAGKGMRQLDILRRARCASRLMPMGIRPATFGWTEGPFVPAARCALSLAKAAADSRAGRDPWGRLEPVRLTLNVSPPREQQGSAGFVDHWLDLRSGLARFMDLALARGEWQRLIAQDEPAGEVRG